MSQKLINIGGSANDGTGDPIRDAFSKVNDNFNEIYSSYVANTSVVVGNTTVNTVVSNTGVTSSNATDTAVATLTNFKIGNSTANSTLSSSQLSVSGNTIVGSASVNTSAATLGNSTVNASLSVTALQISNSTTNVTAGAGSLFVGNSSVNATINSSAINISSASVTSNTLTLGTSTDAANGYTYLPNGFKLQWGWTLANSTVGNAVFSTAYSTNAYVITATRSSNATNNNDVSYAASIRSQNNSTVEIRTSNATSINVYWMAIGK